MFHNSRLERPSEVPNESIESYSLRVQSFLEQSAHYKTRIFNNKPADECSSHAPSRIGRVMYDHELVDSLQNQYLCNTPSTSAANSRTILSSSHLGDHGTDRSVSAASLTTVVDSSPSNQSESCYRDLDSSFSLVDDSTNHVEYTSPRNFIHSGRANGRLCEGGEHECTSSTSEELLPASQSLPLGAKPDSCQSGRITPKPAKPFGGRLTTPSVDAPSSPTSMADQVRALTLSTPPAPNRSQRTAHTISHAKSVPGQRKHLGVLAGELLGRRTNAQHREDAVLDLASTTIVSAIDGESDFCNKSEGLAAYPTPPSCPLDFTSAGSALPPSTVLSKVGDSPPLRPPMAIQLSDSVSHPPSTLELRQLNYALEDASRERALLSATNVELNATLSAALTEVLCLRDRVETLLLERDALASKQHTSECITAVQTAKIGELESKLAELSTSHESLLHAQKRDHHDAMKALSRELDSLRSALNEAQGRKETLEHELEFTKTRLHASQHSVTNLLAEKAELCSQLDDRISTVEKLSADLHHFTDRPGNNGDALNARPTTDTSSLGAVSAFEHDRIVTQLKIKHEQELLFAKSQSLWLSLSSISSSTASDIMNFLSHQTTHEQSPGSETTQHNGSGPPINPFTEPTPTPSERQLNIASGESMPPCDPQDDLSRALYDDSEEILTNCSNVEPSISRPPSALPLPAALSTNDPQDALPFVDTAMLRSSPELQRQSVDSRAPCEDLAAASLPEHLSSQYVAPVTDSHCLSPSSAETITKLITQVSDLEAQVATLTTELGIARQALAVAARLKSSLPSQPTSPNASSSSTDVSTFEGRNDTPHTESVRSASSMIIVDNYDNPNLAKPLKGYMSLPLSSNHGTDQPFKKPGRSSSRLAILVKMAIRELRIKRAAQMYLRVSYQCLRAKMSQQFNIFTNRTKHHLAAVNTMRDDHEKIFQQEKDRLQSLINEAQTKHAHLDQQLEEERDGRIKGIQDVSDKWALECEQQKTLHRQRLEALRQSYESELAQARHEIERDACQRMQREQEKAKNRLLLMELRHSVSMAKLKQSYEQMLEAKEVERDTLKATLASHEMGTPHPRTLFRQDEGSVGDRRHEHESNPRSSGMWQTSIANRVEVDNQTTCQQSDLSDNKGSESILSNATTNTHSRISIALSSTDLDLASVSHLSKGMTTEPEEEFTTTDCNASTSGENNAATLPMDTKDTNTDVDSKRSTTISTDPDVTTLNNNGGHQPSQTVAGSATPCTIGEQTASEQILSPSPLCLREPIVSPVGDFVMPMSAPTAESEGSHHDSPPLQNLTPILSVFEAREDSGRSREGSSPTILDSMTDSQLSIGLPMTFPSASTSPMILALLDAELLAPPDQTSTLQPTSSSNNIHPPTEERSHEQFEPPSTPLVGKQTCDVSSLDPPSPQTSVCTQAVQTDPAITDECIRLQHELNESKNRHRESEMKLDEVVISCLCRLEEVQNALNATVAEAERQIVGYERKLIAERRRREEVESEIRHLLLEVKASSEVSALEKRRLMDKVEHLRQVIVSLTTTAAQQNQPPPPPKLSPHVTAVSRLTTHASTQTSPLDRDVPAKAKSIDHECTHYPERLSLAEDGSHSEDSYSGEVSVWNSDRVAGLDKQDSLTLIQESRLDPFSGHPNASAIFASPQRSPLHSSASSASPHGLKCLDLTSHMSKSPVAHSDPVSALKCQHSMSRFWCHVCCAYVSFRPRVNPLVRLANDSTTQHVRDNHDSTSSMVVNRSDVTKSRDTHSSTLGIPLTTTYASFLHHTSSVSKCSAESRT